MMHKKSLTIWILAALLLGALVPPYAAASSDEDELDPVHHSADAYYLDFEPIGKIQLPRLFVLKSGDGGYAFRAFASTTAAVESGHFHPHFEEEVDAGIVEGETAEGAAPQEARTDYYEAHLEAPEGYSVMLDLSITKHLVFAWLGALIVILIFTRMARMYASGMGRTSAPKGTFQNLFETLVLFIRDEVARPTIGAKADRYLPFLLTAFFFILTCNLLGLVPFGATATSNVMVTAVLATFTFVITQLGGTKDYWKHIFWPPGIPTFVKPILIPVEILGIFTKPFALAIRLFANMTAGHLIILSLIGLIFAFNNLFGPAAGYGVAPVSVAFSLFIYCLEILVSFIQAYVFTMLSALFIGMAAEEHHEHDHEPAGAIA